MRDLIRRMKTKAEETRNQLKMPSLEFDEMILKYGSVLIGTHDPSDKQNDRKLNELFQVNDGLIL